MLYVVKLIKFWMCLKLVVCIAMFALAMIFALPGALRRQKQPFGWFGVGARRTFDVLQRCVEAQGFNGARAVATYVSHTMLDAQRPQDSTTGHGNTFGDNQYVSSGAVGADTRGTLSGNWQQCLSWLAVPIRLVFR